MQEPQHVAAWRQAFVGEHRWPVAIAVLVIITLQMATPPHLAFEPRWLLPVIEGALLLGLVIANPYRLNRESRVLRQTALTLVAVASLAVLWSTARLILVLVTPGGSADNPAHVLAGGATIWATNVVVTSVWFWELDRGGPAARAHARRRDPDFLFPQMTTPHLAHEKWRPNYVDYLYVAFTNATAFSPTDTMPLTRIAKFVMLLESVVSATIVIVVIARAVNAMA